MVRYAVPARVVADVRRRWVGSVGVAVDRDVTVTEQGVEEHEHDERKQQREEQRDGYAPEQQQLMFGRHGLLR